jgi:CHAT domain-containing protein
MFEWYLGAPQRVGRPRRVTSQRTPEQSPLPARLPLLSNQTVLAYGVLPDGLAIWVYDNRGVSAKWVPKSPQELQDLAANFYAECSDPSSELSALRRDGQTLYSLLISPVETQLDPERTLAIETEGFLARLPFEALMDASGHYLIERGPIVRSPGPYAEARMHPDIAISPDLPALVVGSAASSPDTGLFVVPNVLAGADAVASGFHSPRVLAGPEATLAAITKALPSAAVFHFAGHAVTTSNHTGLLIEGRDARTGAPLLLDANVVRHLNLQNMQLAVGANAFVDDFYRSLLSGQPVSNATRLTSRKMLLNPGTAHPYYWAAFAAYGRP